MVELSRELEEAQTKFAALKAQQQQNSDQENSDENDENALANVTKRRVCCVYLML